VQVYLVLLVNLVVTLVTVLLILDALISFAPIDPWHPVRRFLDRMAEPIVRPFRNILPPMGMLDLSPMIALIVVQILGQILIAIIRGVFPG
jgi:YggT family protein